MSQFGKIDSEKVMRDVAAAAAGASSPEASRVSSLGPASEDEPRKKSSTKTATQGKQVTKEYLKKVILDIFKSKYQKAAAESVKMNVKMKTVHHTEERQLRKRN